MVGGDGISSIFGAAGIDEGQGNRATVGQNIQRLHSRPWRCKQLKSDRDL